MPNKAHTEEQIVAVLRQVEAGARVDDVCRVARVSVIGRVVAELWRKRES